MLPSLEFLLDFLLDFFSGFPLLVTQIFLDDLSRTCRERGASPSKCYPFPIPILPSPHFEFIIICRMHFFHLSLKNPPPPNVHCVSQDKSVERHCWPLLQCFYCHPSLNTMVMMLFLMMMMAVMMMMTVTMTLMKLYLETVAGHCSSASIVMHPSLVRKQSTNAYINILSHLPRKIDISFVNIVKSK